MLFFSNLYYVRQRTFEKKENRDILLFENFAHLYYKDPNVLVFLGGILLTRFFVSIVMIVPCVLF